MYEKFLLRSQLGLISSSSTCQKGSCQAVSKNHIIKLKIRNVPLDPSLEYNDERFHSLTVLLVLFHLPWAMRKQENTTLHTLFVQSRNYFHCYSFGKAKLTDQFQVEEDLMAYEQLIVYFSTQCEELVLTF